MRIVTWNLAGQTLGIATHAAAWRHLTEVLQPDLALLQEARRLPDLEPKLGGTIAFQPVSGVDWGTAVWAPAGTVTKIDMPSISTPWMDYVRICIADLTRPDEAPIRAVSVHPHAGKFDPALLGEHPELAPKLDGATYVWSCDVAYTLARQHVTGHQPFVVGGDWNTARRFDTTSPELDPGTGTGEAFFARAEQDGWHDCYHQRHHHEGRTWFRGNDHGYQLDHLFTDQTTGQRVKDCWIDERAAVDPRLSDHAPLVVDLT